MRECSSGVYLEDLSQATDGLNDVIYVVIGESRIKWQAKGFCVKRFRIWAFAGRVAIGLAIPRLKVNGDVKNLGADAMLPEIGHDLGAGPANGHEINLYGVEMPRDPVFRCFGVSVARWLGVKREPVCEPGCGEPWQIGERLVILGDDFLAALDEAWELLQLGTAQGALDFGDPVVVAEFLHFIEPRTVFGGQRTEDRGQKTRRIALDAVSAQEAGAAGVFVVVGDKHAAFAGGHGFDRMKTEDRHVSPRMATKFPLLAIATEPTARAMTGILDNHRSSGPGDAGDFRHVARLAGIVHGDDGFGIGLPSCFERCGVEVVGDGINIAEIRDGADISRAIGGSQKRVGRGNHPVAGADVGHEHCQMQGSGGIADGDGMLCSDALRELPLEGFDFRSAGEKVRAQRADNGGDVVVVDGLATVGEHGREVGGRRSEGGGRRSEGGGR